MKTRKGILIFCLLFSLAAADAGAILDAKSIFADDTPAQQPNYSYSAPVQETPVPYHYTGDVTSTKPATAYSSGSAAANNTPVPQYTPAQDGTSVTIQLQVLTDSDTISAVGYSENALILAVQMRATGEIRCYRMVSKILYVKFMESAAKDTFFANQIDGRYERIM